MKIPTLSVIFKSERINYAHARSTLLFKYNTGILIYVIPVKKKIYLSELCLIYSSNLFQHSKSISPWALEGVATNDGTGAATLVDGFGFTVY
jgi:hypothetical protein